MAKLPTDTIIWCDGTRIETAPTDPRKGYKLKELQSIVGGNIELVRRTTVKGMILVVNEEGLLHSLPHNPHASDLAGQHIVGNVLLCADGHVK